MLLDAGVTVTVGVTGPDDELLPPPLPQPLNRNKPQKKAIKQEWTDFICRYTPKAALYRYPVKVFEKVRPGANCRPGRKVG
jgi:hypothetical protein